MESKQKDKRESKVDFASSCQKPSTLAPMSPDNKLVLQRNGIAARINKNLIVFKYFYFLFYSAAGTTFPFLVRYFHQIGLSNGQVLMLSTVRPVVQLVFSPLWGILGDRFVSKKMLIQFSLLIWLIATISMAFLEPTEQVCQFVSINESKTSVINSTTMRTGFFRRRRSVIDIVETPLTTEPQIEIKTNNLDKVVMSGAGPVSDHEDPPTYSGSGQGSPPKPDQTPTKMAELSKTEQSNLDPTLKTAPQIKERNVLRQSQDELSHIFVTALSIITIVEMFACPLLVLIDAVLLSKQNEENFSYGQQRVFGSLGYLTFFFILNALLQNSLRPVCGDMYADFVICFCFFALVTIVTLIGTVKFPPMRPASTCNGTRPFHRLKTIFYTKHFGALFVNIGFMGFAHSILENYYNSTVMDPKVSYSTSVTINFFRSIGEPLALFFSSMILNRAGMINVLFGIPVVTALNLFASSFITSPWHVIPLGILDGCTYGVSWVACATYLIGSAPDDCTATVQGMRPIVQFASAPFWAIMADRYKKRKPILVMSILSWLIMTLALAFVEPTNEICEMRVENNTTLQFINYTKIKTGFFRRSMRLATSAGSGDKITSPDLVAIPMIGTYNLKVKLRDNTKEKQTVLISNSTNRKASPTLKQQLHSSVANRTSNSSISSHSQQPGYRSVLDPKATSLAGESPRTSKIIIRRNMSVHVLQNSLQDVHSEPVGYNKAHADNNNKNAGLNSMKREQGFRAKGKPTLPRRLISTSNLGYSSEKNTLDGDPEKAKIVNLKRKKSSGDRGAIAGTLKAGKTVIKQKRWDELQTGNRSETTRAQPAVIEFSRGDFTTSQKETNSNDSETFLNEKNANGGSGEQELSGDQEEQALRSGNISIPKHVKEAAEKLQKQLTKSMNFLSNIARNSSEVLLHHTIAMFSKKEDGEKIAHTSSPKTIPQLSNAIKDFVKLNKEYVSSENMEGSAEGSSLLLSSDHDLASLAIAHMMITKHGLNTPDNLHQEERKEANSGVIHHNVLPHHVLAFSHNSTVGLSVAQMVGDNDDTKTASSESREGSGTKITLAEKTRTGDDVYNFTKTDGKSVDKQSFDGNLMDNKSFEQQEDLSRQSESATEPPSTFSGVVSQVHTTLRNLLKTNKREMSRIFTVLLVLVVVGEFLEAPSATLADASLLEVLGENRQFYGKQRLFGSIGFGVCSFIVGVMLERSRHVVCGDEYIDYMICFCVFGIMMFMTLLITSSFEFHYSDTPSSSGRVFSSLCNMHYGSCLVAACIMGIDFSMSHNFLTWFLEDLGAKAVGCRPFDRPQSQLPMDVTFVVCSCPQISHEDIGYVARGVGCCYGFLFHFVNWYIDDKGGSTLIMGAAAAARELACFYWYSIITSPWMAVPLEALDGAVYGLVWCNSINYMSSLGAPIGAVVIMQGILQGVFYGLVFDGTQGDYMPVPLTEVQLVENEKEKTDKTSTNSSKEEDLQQEE
ncbi:hypothetical protein QZH41_000442 [Actinostola sp. cb2023]|nr:hypothetical protein QZH41_000442 [Actinostola sp. cb2023]